MSTIQEWLVQSDSFLEATRAFCKKGITQIYGVSGSQKSFLFSQTMQDNPRPTLIVVHDKEHKERWERDLAFFMPQYEVINFPLVDKVRFTVTAKSLENQATQMRALSAILMGKPVAVVALAEEAAQKILSPTALADNMLSFKTGQEVVRTDLLDSFITLGYERVDQVEQRGHFAVRGDIIDIFPVNEPSPLRMEFFGDEIDTIRIFDEETQRSSEHVVDFAVMPLHLKAIEEESSLLSYGEKGIIIYDEPNRIEERLKNYIHEVREHEETHHKWTGFIKSAESPTKIVLSFLQQKLHGLIASHTIGLQSKSMSSFERQIPLFVDEVEHWLSIGRQVVIVMNNLQRREGLQRAFEEGHIPYFVGKELQVLDKTVLILEGLLSEGFELPQSKFTIVSEGNIYGQQKRKLRKKASKGQEINYFTDLTVGDYVVHSIHGIGKYAGLKTIETEGRHKDYIEIDYAGTDRLFLPADNLDQLQKYIGNEGEAPRLHKMGGSEWRRIKGKAQKSIDDLAAKLVTLYAEREVVQGYAFLPDQPWQEEFESAFPYEETADQLQAIKEIKASMEKPHPMDRLLCGDVGFGKTEVAMRAIFKAVMSGKQVAVLVPTTILAQQHYQTFFNRFNPFGVKVEVLNRFRSIKEKRQILEGALQGTVDVIIGTHALLSKDVKFKDLGLLVVDEEQRFGVAQKEKWKTWAKNVDVLSLSATPIPRTLHMSLVGVREMSIINTPPEERLPVQTYVVEFDMELVKEAIRRELQRGGQVYFIYNRVASINHMADLLEAAMPDLKYCVAHGQMTGSQMESIMVDFYEGRYDVLLCTSIVENGLDIPNANTIVVYDADHLGLSQLYQMRGRVGRSRRRAYAYFMHRPDKVLSETAEKRLQAIKEFTELGAGFKLAMRDLEIRGAGNLLGSQQHGNIASVGFAMYCTMLEEAIAKAQNREVSDPVVADPTIDLGVDAFIDDTYISDNARKISLYQRLLHIKSQAELADFRDELFDRFGTPTDAVDNLLRLADIKERARTLGIKSILLREHMLTIVWATDDLMQGWDIGAVDQTMWKRMKFKEGKPTTLRVNTAGIKQSILVFVEALCTELSKREITV